MIRLHAFDRTEALVETLAAKTLERLAAARDAAGVTWLVSGGSTPKVLFARVRQMSFDWEGVRVALVDERWVPRAHPRSNEAFVAKHLGPVFDRGAQLVGMYRPEHPSPVAAAPDVEASYRALPPVGACLLGLGPDGHTASLFPDADGLEAALDPDGPRLVAPIRAHPSEVTGDELERLSLAAPGLLQAGFPHLLITGANKRAALEAALDEGALPIRRVSDLLPEPLDVYWAP